MLLYLVVFLLLLSGTANARSDNWLAMISSGDKLHCQAQCNSNDVWFGVGGSCAAAGHKNGCCQGGVNHCTVRISGEICYCDEGCFATGECCSDIHIIGCYGSRLAHTFCIVLLFRYTIATTCANAGLDPGCCSWLQTSCSTGSSTRTCYCDRFCHYFRDCCTDVPKRSLLDCSGMKGISPILCKF